MPVSSIPGNSRLVLSLIAGTKVDGNPLLKNRSYNFVKADALDQDVFDVGQAIAGLQTLPLYITERIDREALINA